jgi:HEAT repeat protein
VPPNASRARSLLCAAALGAAVIGTTAEARAFVWPNVPDQVARALAGGDVSERRLAAQRIRELPPEIAVRLAQRAMGDPDVEVRLRAAQAATLLRVPRAGDWVVGWLSEGDARLRLAACEVIHAGPTERSIAALGRVLGDPEAHVRLAAASAMAGSMLPVAVSPLLGHLDDPAPEVRAEVARALGRIGDVRAAVPLVGKVQDSVPEVRRVVARALGELGDARAVGALMLALQDVVAEVRVEAVTALGRLGADEATVAIAPLAESDGDVASTAGRGAAAPPGEVRAAALRALGLIGSEAAVKVLVGALAKDDPSAQRSPVRAALVGAGKAAVKPLVAALEGSPSSSTASGAALALGELRAKEGEPAIVRAMQRGALPLRYGLRALTSLGSASALPSVLELLADADAGVRKEAIQAASALLDESGGDGRAVDPATAALRDPATPLDERVELVRLLGKTGAPRARAALRDLAQAKSLPLRLAALDALGGLRGAGSVGAGAAEGADLDAILLGALDDESAEVRLRAAMALARVASPATAPRLLERLAVAAEQDRGALGIALSGAMARVTDAALVERVGAAVAVAPDVARDALLEGLGRAHVAAAGRVLARLAGGTTIDDRRKVAEALAGHPEALAALRALAADADPGVRANATWSLGVVGGKDELPALAALVRDPDAAVAGDAAAALGRVAVRAGSAADASAALCGALADARPYVRANAVAAASLAGVACPGAAPAELLARDGAESVRLAAADALGRVLRAAASPDLAAARKALARCASEERNATVASRCAHPEDGPAGVAPGGALDEVGVFVVPDGRTAPMPRAPFALVRPDGLLRLGTADRRGALLEVAVPRGVIRLAVPAALVR